MQLDRRNNLLYFRPGRTAVRVVEHTPDSIIEALSAPSASRRGLSFDYETPKPRKRADNFDFDDEDDEELDLAIPGDLSGDCPALELQRRLRNLRRRAREWEEEQGLSVLFLALGFLNWIDEDGQSAASPLLMLPVNLARESPRSPFTLREDDDEDFTTNSTLAVKLNEFGIKLPEDPEIETASLYLDSIRKLVRQRPGWNVSDEVYLAIFAYSKLAMWRDLEDVKNNGTDSSIVKMMAGAESPQQEDATGDVTPTALPAPLPDDLAGARLDDLLDVRDQFAVLPADYSQVRAIAAARSGHNLVLHGPPGTGKSQTIANIAATLLAEGKSVLFVSEKTAALDVVKSRLDKRRLGVFCLDLHSERGKKANVYQQLQESVEDPRAVRLLEFAYAALAGRRDRLNQFVRALHQVRQPLGQTAFQVQGSFVNVREAPDVPFEVEDIETLDQVRLAEILEAADRIRLRPKEFREHWTSPWRVLKDGSASLELADKIRRDMQTVSVSVEAARAETAELAESLGLPPPETLDEAAPLLDVARHLARAPGVPWSWLQEGAVERLMEIAGREAAIQSERGRLIEQLGPWFGEPIPDWDFADIRRRLAVSPVEAEQLNTVLGGQWTRSILRPNSVASGELQQLCDAVLRLRSAAAQAVDFLRSEPAARWTEIQGLLYVTQFVGQSGPVPVSWVEPGGIEAVAVVVEQARQLAQDLDRLEGRVFLEFEPDVLEVVDREMLTRYRTDYQSRLRRTMPGRYRSDHRAIQACHRTGGKLTFSREQQLVGDIVDLKRQQAAWRDMEAGLVFTLVSRQAGRGTNWEAAHRDIGTVKELINSRVGDTAQMRRLLTEEASVRRCRELAGSLAQAAAEVTGLVDDHLSADLSQQFREGTVILPALEELAQQAAAEARRIEEVSAAPLAAARREIPDLAALQELISASARLRELEREQSEAEAALRSGFGRRYAVFDTNWHEVRDSLEWTRQLLVLAPPNEVTPALAVHAGDPREPSFYENMTSSVERVLQQTQAQLASLLDDYNLRYAPFDSPGLPVASWEQAQFHQVLEWAGELSGDADSAGDWLTYRAAVADLDRLTSPSTTGSIRDQIDDIVIVPRIIQRRIWTAWLDWLYSQDPLLGLFAAPEQEDLVAKFKELDGQLVDAAQDEVRRRVFEKYPNFSVADRGVSEPGILRGELSKRRRQWPVRRLFERIPRLIQTMKPCVLVSPLAVSQYLPLALDFDVVIFDEASQVFPEDAVPAILRGRQLVLAGDRKQLPPSNFFRRSANDNEYDDDDDGPQDQLAGRESILDTAVGLVGRTFTEEHLNVHYRSRDESLIRFSNHHFYDDRLIIFPSPGIGGSWNGVHDVYVPEGRYDAGASRTNRIEADCVVDLVFRHFRTRPGGESLGVVALSRAQADLIDRMIEKRRILEPDIGERFNERPDEPFFVKNLENVQGDERDRIIISVGYGPTAGSGAVPNRFGPLNSVGGERRLNVVVSRAKQRIDLVHSLRDTDITSEQAGARLLRRYLEYAAAPWQAFESQATVDPAAETESPFEEAVERALIARGHRVARQVGIVGYRIDLAILSEDGDAFDLGIECDGRRYHSAPAARDRDWLRQQVLEGLGWRIHRVWSTAWVRNPEAELDRIEAALGASRSQSKSSEGLHGPKAYPPTTQELPDVVQGTVTVAPAAEVALADYEIARLARRYREDLLFENEGTLASLVEIIAKDEGPVHKDIVMERIRGCYGIRRSGRVTRDKVERGIQLARSSGAVRGDGTFVWLDDGQLSRQPRRCEGRKIEYVHSSELQSLILATVRALFGTTRNGLITEVARHLGFRRNGPLISEAIGANVQQLIDSSQLVEEFDMIRLAG